MFRLSKGWGINPEQVRTFDIAKREEEISSWPREKRLVFVNDMTDTFGEFHSFDLIEEWHKFFKRQLRRQFQLLAKKIGRATIKRNSRSKRIGDSLISSRGRSLS